MNERNDTKIEESAHRTRGQIFSSSAIFTQWHFLVIYGAIISRTPCRFPPLNAALKIIRIYIIIRCSIFIAISIIFTVRKIELLLLIPLFIR